MGETFASGKQIITDIFNEGIKNMMIEKGDKCKSPDELANEFPMQFIDHTKEEPIRIIQQARDMGAYLHIGYFRESGSSTRYRDDRLKRPATFSKPCEIVCMRGEIFAWKKDGFHAIQLLEPEGGQWIEQELVADCQPFLRDK